MSSSRWPMAGLRLRTPTLELRWPRPGDLDALADLAALGVHDPDVQPFTAAWTDVPPDERARSTMQYHWSRWASWTPWPTLRPSACTTQTSSRSRPPGPTSRPMSAPAARCNTTGPAGPPGHPRTGRWNSP